MKKEMDSESDSGNDQPEADMNIVDPANAPSLEPPARAAKTPAEVQQEAEDVLFATSKYSRRFNIDMEACAAQSQAFAEKTEAFTLAWSNNSAFLAAGCGDGSIRVYNAGGKQMYLLRPPTEDSLPTTCLEFRPETSSSKTQNVLLAANADGTVSHWHMMSKTCLYKITEENNQILTVGYRPDGAQFATGGRDTAVRIYEESTKTLLMTLKAGLTERTTGHTNRVYAVKYMPNDPHIVLSGGWDNTVQIWDLRTGSSVRSLFGPHICGGSLDISSDGKTILTGSFKPENGLPMWDYGTGKLVEDIPWSVPAKGGKGRPDMLYAASYSPDNTLIAAGGCGTKEAKIFQVEAGQPTQVVDRITMGSKGCYAVAFAPNGRTLAVGGGDSVITTVDLV